MANDQQFCLRWNNHQTTLVEIFDKLLSNDRLVDCTLAAEGQYLRAHKVLLSACSPYFELLLSQHNDKHPIIILKDVTFRELRALMDYMYRGEVNVSQDQLGALLKVAENLQIKGLSDSGGGGTEPKDNKPPDKRPLPPPPPAQQQTPIIPRPGLTIEHHRSNQLDLSHDSPSALDGSPVPRKRKRMRRRSSDDESSLGHTPVESHHDSSSRESSSLSIPPNVASNPLSKSAAVIPEPPPVLDRTDHILPEPAQPIQDVVHKTEPNTEMLLEPKHEYPDDVNEDSVEDLTLEDDVNDLNQSQAGPSGEGSSNQGFTPWHMATDRSTDEVFMQAQEAVGAQRDSQDGGENQRTESPKKVLFICPKYCGTFKTKSLLLNHECPKQFRCPMCQAVFQDMATWQKHVKNERCSLFFCSACKVLFKTAKLLANHVCNRFYKCETCNEVFTYRNDFVVHTKLQCGKVMQCPQCNESFQGIKNLKSHKCVQIFTCSICKKIFDNSQAAKDHANNECGQLFNKNLSQETAEVETAGEKSFKCLKCPETFACYSKLRTHTNHECGAVVKCATCNKVFEHRKELEIHAKHECGKILQCEKCNKTFKTLAYLKTHTKYICK